MSQSNNSKYFLLSITLVKVGLGSRTLWLIFTIVWEFQSGPSVLTTDESASSTNSKGSPLTSIGCFGIFLHTFYNVCHELLIFLMNLTWFFILYFFILFFWHFILVYWHYLSNKCSLYRVKKIRCFVLLIV